MEATVATVAAEAREIEHKAAPTPAPESRLHKPTRKHLPGWVYRLCGRIWEQLEDLFEEFGPWFKWLVYDALLTIVVGWLATRFEGLRPYFETLGWL